MYISPTLLVSLTVCSVGFYYLTTRYRMLSVDGALAAIVIAFVVSLSAGPLWLLPLFVFFGSSSLLGRVFPAKSDSSDEKQARPRDAVQVVANGGLYAVVAFCGQYVGFAADKHLWWSSLLCIMAIMTADTWSSQVGQYYRQPTYDIVRWRRVPIGLSGGVSLAGTIAGILGSLSIAWLYSLMVENSMNVIATLTLFGFLGMLVDSLLGSTLQATYRDKTTGLPTDSPGANKVLIDGYDWMTNDLVNLLTTIITYAMYYLTVTYLT